jgi:hypothetical protein
MTTSRRDNETLSLSTSVSISQPYANYSTQELLAAEKQVNIMYSEQGEGRGRCHGDPAS